MIYELGTISDKNNSGNGNNYKTLWSGKIAEENLRILTGNFSTGKSDQLITISDKGKISLLNFDSNKFSILTNEFLPDFKNQNNIAAVAVNMDENKSEEILLSYSGKKEKHCFKISFVNNKLVLKEFKNTDLSYNTFNPEYLYFPFYHKNTTSLLGFSQIWRFHLTVVSSDQNNLYTSSIPVFKGYYADRNPKYYEFPRLIPGRFVNNETSILCILYNCEDENFNGKKCMRYDNLNDLPNSIQLYSFVK
jgi:hypothetical protein